MELELPQTSFWLDQGGRRKAKSFDGVLEESESWVFDDNETAKSIVLSLWWIAYQLDGKTMTKLKDDHDWLSYFEPGSKSGWQRLKDEYYANAPAFLDVLDEFTRSKRAESQIMAVVDIDSHRDGVMIQTMLFICKELHDLHSENRAFPVQGSDDKDLTDFLSRSKLSVIRDSPLLESRLEELCKKTKHAYGKSYDLGHRTLKQKQLLEFRVLCSIFQVAWEQRDKDPTFDRTNDASLLCKQFMGQLRADLSLYKKHAIWRHYEGTVKDFVHQVGCAKSHDTPEANIAELRLFHSTTIGYFSELQSKYLKTELELKELRRQITALEFRHLLERLPDPALDQHAGPRWTKFWDKALKYEAAGHEIRVQIKALEEKIAKLQGPDNQEEKERKEAELKAAKLRLQPYEQPKHALTSIMDDRNPSRNHEDVTTQNATVAIEGVRLYNKLSDEIHRYPGKEYRVGESEGWDVAIADILRALKPVNFKDKEKKEVDWVKERERYISAAPEGTTPDKDRDNTCSWDTEPMRKQLTLLQKRDEQRDFDIGRLKREVKDLKLNAVGADDPDVNTHGLFDVSD